MSESAIRILRDRVAELDSPLVPADASAGDPRLERAVSVMSFCTDTEMAAVSGGTAVLTPDAADEATRDCRLLREIARTDASLVEGPLRRDRQRWIGTAAPPGTAPPTGTPAPLDRSRFTEATAAAGHPPEVKPFRHGLFTSTATRGGAGMWEMYLRPYHGSDLFPLPWQVWQVEPTAEASVLDITSARDWADFVERYAREHQGIVHPDWEKAAQDVSGVHLTLRAIVATQGFQFRTASGLTAAPYWDVETTLWLRWHFSSVRCLDVIH
ncbi:hypothetical protein [Streptomyces sp. NPDC087294]|uniref:hypothetical protein n=1 Tax=Streptomyces sp. NPDC087294 TaxID=3365777 RepID=UPI0037FB5548